MPHKHLTFVVTLVRYLSEGVRWTIDIAPRRSGCARADLAWRRRPRRAAWGAARTMMPTPPRRALPRKTRRPAR